jgi:hypothetical protein
LLAQYLCGFTPAPGKHLVAVLRGVQVVHSFEKEGWLDLTLEVPRQTPKCSIRERSLPVPKEGLKYTNVPPAYNAQSLSGSPYEASADVSESAKPILVQRNQGEF